MDEGHMKLEYMTQMTDGIGNTLAIIGHVRDT